MLDFRYAGKAYPEELGPQNHNRDGLLGLKSRMVVYKDPFGSVFHRDPCGGKVEGGRGLYFLKIGLIRSILRALRPPTPLGVFMSVEHWRWRRDEVIPAPVIR